MRQASALVEEVCKWVGATGVKWRKLDADLRVKRKFVDDERLRRTKPKGEGDQPQAQEEEQFVVEEPPSPITIRSSRTFTDDAPEECAVCLAKGAGLRKPCCGTPFQKARRGNEKRKRRGLVALQLFDVKALEEGKKPHSVAVYCAACGAYATRVSRGIGATCPKVIADGRRQAAKDLCDGFLPATGRKTKIVLGW